MQMGATSERLSQSRLFSAIREHEGGVTSNCGSSQRSKPPPVQREHCALPYKLCYLLRAGLVLAGIILQHSLYSKSDSVRLVFLACSLGACCSCHHLFSFMGVLDV